MRYILIVLLFSNLIFPQQVILKQSTLSSAGIVATGESSRLMGTVGQSFTGLAESEATFLSVGLWGSISLVMLGIDDILPTEFAISNAYPNPFNPTINIDFSIPDESDINIKIFDLLGRNIFTHKQNFISPGKYQFKWHGLHDTGTPIASGVYLITIQYKTNIIKQKITFLK